MVDTFSLCQVNNKHGNIVELPANQRQFNYINRKNSPAFGRNGALEVAGNTEEIITPA